MIKISSRIKGKQSQKKWKRQGLMHEAQQVKPVQFCREERYVIFFCEDDQSDLSVHKSFHLFWISVPFTLLAVMTAQNLACHGHQRSVVWGFLTTFITTQNSPCPPKKYALENIVYHFSRQLWLFLGVKMMELNSNLFSRVDQQNSPSPN